MKCRRVTNTDRSLDLRRSPLQNDNHEKRDSTNTLRKDVLVPIYEILLNTLRSIVRVLFRKGRQNPLRNFTNMLPMGGK